MRSGTLTALMGLGLGAVLAWWQLAGTTPPAPAGTPPADRARPAPPAPEGSPPPPPEAPAPGPRPGPAVEREALPAAPRRPDPPPPPSDPEEALAYYAQVLKASKPFADEWWDAKYWSLVSWYRRHLRLKTKGRAGDAHRALVDVRMLLENLRLVAPTLGGPESAKRFRALANDVGLTTGWEPPNDRR